MYYDVRYVWVERITSYTKFIYKMLTQINSFYAKSAFILKESLLDLIVNGFMCRLLLGS